jgi:hypothetical protein
MMLSAARARTAALAALLAGALPAAGCRSSALLEDTGGHGQTGGGACPDLSSKGFPPDAGTAPLSCGSDCTDWVWDSLAFPTSTEEADQVAVVEAGKRYNAFGSLLASINAFVGSSGQLTPSVKSGEMVVLLRLKAKNLVDCSSVGAEWWAGEPTTCCTSTSDPTACASEAAKTCFGGSAKLRIAKQDPGSVVASGSLAGGRLSIGPAPFLLRLVTNLSATPVDLPLVRARIEGTVSSSGISSGVLAGGIPAWAVDARMLPLISGYLDAYYKSTATLAIKRSLREYFDLDKNGTITACELRTNTLLTPLLAADVDLDGDGQKELSFGVAFHAVRAVILDAQASVVDAAGGS